MTNIADRRSKSIDDETSRLDMILPPLSGRRKVNPSEFLVRNIRTMLPMSKAA